MKRHIFTFAMALMLVIAGVALAQTQSTMPPDQQVDQTGQPETGPGPDVDVDLGRNAEDGVVDVDVSRTTDPDTAAQGNDPATPTGQTNLQNETEPVNGPDVDVDTGDRAAGAVDVDVSRTGDADTSATGIDETGSLDNDANDTTTGVAADQDNLPGTASNLPAVALLGLLAMAAAFTVRFLRS